MKIFMDHKASPDWAVRRRIIILSLLWEAGLTTAIIVDALVRITTNSLLEMALINLCSLFGATVGTYVFGAIWDAKSQRSADIAQSVVDNAGQGDPANTTTTTNVTVQQ